MELPHDPAIPLFGVYLKSQNTKRVVIHICCCMIHSSQETESVGMPTNRKIEKKILCTCTKIMVFAGK